MKPGQVYNAIRRWFRNPDNTAVSSAHWHSTGQARWQPTKMFPSGHFLWRIYCEEVNLMSSQVSTRWIGTNLGTEISKVEPLADATSRYQAKLSAW